MLRDHSIPVRKILERIFEIRGPDWLPDEQTLNYIRSLKATP